MSLYIKCAAYMALIFEGTLTVLNLFEIIKFSKIMKFDIFDSIILCTKMWQVICFTSLALGIVFQARFLVRLWLLWSYIQLDWASIGSLIGAIYDYCFSEKYSTRSEFLQLMGKEYSGLISQVLTRVGVILMVYKFYKSLELPKHKQKMQLAQMATQPKAK